MKFLKMCIFCIMRSINDKVRSIIDIFLPIILLTLSFIVFCLSGLFLLYFKGKFSFRRRQLFMKFFKMCIFRNLSGSIRIFMSIVPLCR